VAALYVFLKLIKEQQQRSSMLFTGVPFISVAKLRDICLINSFEFGGLPMFAAVYGGDAARKSNRQRKIRFSRARIIAILILSQVHFLLDLLNSLEY
jgi:hypothetical protein